MTLQSITNHIQRVRSDVIIYKGPLAAASVHMWSHPTLPDQYIQRPDHNTGNCAFPTLYEQWVGSLTNYYEQGLWDGTYGLLSLSEKTRKSGHLITKAALSPRLFKDPEWWSGRVLNPRPCARQSGTLPTKLTGQWLTKNPKYNHVNELT